MSEQAEITTGPRPLDRLLPGLGVALGRAVVYLILLLAAVAILWARLAELDVVVQARGRVMVGDEPIRVTTSEAGLVVEIGVRVGDRVKAGALLLRLDSFKYGSEAEQIRAELAALLAEVARHGEAAREIRASARFMRDEIDSTKKAAGIVRGQLDMTRALHAQGVVPAIDVQSQDLALTEMQIRLARLEGELNERENQATERERQAKDGRDKANVLAKRLTQISGFERRLTLVAPVAGTIIQLAVLHPGSVISTSEPAVVLAPDDKPLMAAIQIPNASMQRLRAGLPVRMRFDAYPYQDFGDLEGELARIDPDADAAGTYRAWVTMPRPQLSGPRGVAPLTAGLLLGAEIVVDRRTVLDFLLRPFRRLTGPVRMSE